MTTQEHDPDAVRGVTPLPFAQGVGSQLVQGGDLRLIGWSIVEVTGAGSAQVDILDGQGASATTVGVIGLTAGQSFTGGPGARGVQIKTGLSVMVNSGSVRGTLYVIDN